MPVTRLAHHPVHLLFKKSLQEQMRYLLGVFLNMRTESGSDRLLNSLAAMPFLELPNELIERTLIELHPMEVVGIRQESQFVASFCPSPEKAVDLSRPPIAHR
jgi:hypothetical protein